MQITIPLLHNSSHLSPFLIVHPRGFLNSSAFRPLQVNSALSSSFGSYTNLPTSWQPHSRSGWSGVGQEAEYTEACSGSPEGTVADHFPLLKQVDFKLKSFQAGHVAEQVDQDVDTSIQNILLTFFVLDYILKLG